ncbi:DNA-directed RNA polymerase subunit omega [Natranaerobius thermophilus]|uniref:DNA-directed RNA polymerase subunit omega n=1 Tax=Natranaerobius thermophilus (strain ATCC BAA-1301 / DSM 18059 / JW/NM-WN-LF) TaxID=457570 RepID=B2A2J8_NATTJ|nr:DNA-directed RNA polymerase subunit omega [Natranaerobius thermophilus]ACB84913.1 DNA-directed RNA polymerase, omega subunit [Natranaerobius thermophilus JW/NM-WN-LF]
MNEPAVDNLVEQVESKYSLVIAVAKRAREIVDGSPSLVENKSPKSVTVALKEIDANKLNYHKK